ncbi:hypothetical protein Tco_1563224 [Tanacetum coccineum]
MHTRASNSELVELYLTIQPTSHLLFLIDLKITSILQKQSNPTPENCLFANSRHLLFRHFLDILQNYDPIDDEPMWDADRIFAPTPGSAITIPETAKEFAINGRSNSDTDKIMARMDAMTVKMDAQYKYFQSRLKQPNLDDDDIPMSREEEAKFMQTFRRTRLYNDYRDPKLDGLTEKQSGRPSGSLPSNTQPNPKDNPNNQQNNSKTPINFDSDDENDEPTPQPKPKTPIPVKETPTPKPYKLKIPYPQHLRKEKMEAQYGKFLDMIQAVRINKKLNLGVGTERMIFHIDFAMKHSYSNDDTCFSIDVIEEILEEDSDALLDEGSEILHSIEGTILEEKLFAEFDELWQ